jgi:hypothetical protein
MGWEWGVAGIQQLGLRRYFCLCQLLLSFCYLLTLTLCLDSFLTAFSLLLESLPLFHQQQSV